MKAETGFSRQSTSPTSTFEASAPAGIFFKNDVFPCWCYTYTQKKENGKCLKPGIPNDMLNCCYYYYTTSLLCERLRFRCPCLSRSCCAASKLHWDS
jgi:hypothetical protein